MPRRKPAAAPKGKAKPKSAPTRDALTKTQRDYEKFRDATNAAVRESLAPVVAQLAEVSRQITSRQTRVLKDIAASVRAAAEARGEYALVLPSPAHALIPRNAEHAAQVYPEAHTWQPKPYAAQTSLEDEPRDSAEYFALLTAGLSAPSRVLLSLIGGRWADGTQSPACVFPKTHAADGSCRHYERAVPFTLNALARDLYGSAGGKQVAQVYALLAELESVQITYGKTDTQNGVERSAAKLYEPLVVGGLKGIGFSSGESRSSGNLHRHLLLAKGLHEEYLRGSYKMVRRALLVGWVGWQQELALRLYAHNGTWYGSKRLRNQSADGRSGTIRIGKTRSLDLGALTDLLPSYDDNPAALLRKLQEFAQEMNSRSEPTELHIVGITPIRKGRHTEGWALDIAYPEQPLTGKQARRLKIAKDFAALTAGSREQKAEQVEQAPVVQRAAEQPLRVEVDSYGNEVVVLAPALPRAAQEGKPTCSHGVAFTLQPAGVSKAGKPYAAFWQARHRLDNGEWCKERRLGTP